MAQVQNNKYDLEERTAQFGEEVIDFCKIIPHNEINSPLIKQIIRSATSIGANYMEANGAESRKDFFHKIHLCKKEAKETMHWLRMISRANSNLDDKNDTLRQEVKELTLIFSKICQKSILKN